ncbi:hypothetical protein JW935_10680 [candidate division KSB1 bacterium]|nr:hypothetical protein [candidate division KSB1 bacterium]
MKNHNKSRIIQFLQEELSPEDRFYFADEMKKNKKLGSHPCRNHLDDETMLGFIEEKLSSRLMEKTRKHIKKCSKCLQRMADLEIGLERASKQVFIPTPDFMQQRVYRLGSDKAKNILKDKISIRLKQLFNNTGKNFDTVFYRRVTFGLSLAGAAVFVFYMFVYHSEPVKNYPLTSQLLVFERRAMGFVPEPKVFPYKGMSVSVSEDKKSILFDWEAVPEASFYELYLWTKENQPECITPETGITGTTFCYNLTGIDNKTRYSWELRGFTKTGTRFQARAQFEVRL